jgi:hypothetical protein
MDVSMRRSLNSAPPFVSTEGHGLQDRANMRNDPASRSGGRALIPFVTDSDALPKRISLEELPFRDIQFCGARQ